MAFISIFSLFCCPLLCTNLPNFCCCGSSFVVIVQTNHPHFFMVSTKSCIFKGSCGSGSEQAPPNRAEQKRQKCKPFIILCLFCNSGDVFIQSDLQVIHTMINQGLTVLLKDSLTCNRTSDPSRIAVLPTDLAASLYTTM